MIWKRIGRQVLNGVDELAGSFKVNRAVRSAVKEGGEEAAKNASKAAKEIGEDVAERIGKRNAANQAEQAVKSEAKKTYNQAVHGVNEAKKGSDSATKAIQREIDTPITKYDYRQRVVNNQEIFERRPTGSNGSWANIDNVEYANARRGAHSNSSEFTFESRASSEDVPALVKAQEVAQTGAGDNAGFDLMQFAADHPVGTALAGLGVGVVGANLLDND